MYTYLLQGSGHSRDRAGDRQRTFVESEGDCERHVNPAPPGMGGVNADISLVIVYVGQKC